MQKSPVEFGNRSFYLSNFFLKFSCKVKLFICPNILLFQNFQLSNLTLKKIIAAKNLILFGKKIDKRTCFKDLISKIISPKGQFLSDPKFEDFCCNFFRLNIHL